MLYWLSQNNKQADLNKNQVNFSLDTIKLYFKWVLLSILVGLSAGFAATLFLFMLKWATETRLNHEWIIWFLPIAGLLIGLWFHYYGQPISAGNNLIIDEIHQPKNKIPFRMAPMILLGTVITHFFGGSAGREGTAVQMGSSLADQIGSFFKVNAQERKMLLVAGAGAGFGAAIGAPWAGVLFGLEVIHIGKIRLFAWIDCLIASFVSYYVTIVLKAPHSIYPKLPELNFEWRTFIAVALFGGLCGLCAFLFIKYTHAIEIFFSKFISFSPLRPMIAGLLLVIFYYLEGSYTYAGLGIETIQSSLSQATQFNIPLMKGLFTGLTIGSGFKGGEFIPLVFIGTTLGSAIATFLGTSIPLLASLGFAAVFAGAANTPIACTLMAMEIFGPQIGVYAFIACFFSYYCSGTNSIYKTKKTLQRKHHLVYFLMAILGELPRRFIKNDQ